MIYQTTNRLFYNVCFALALFSIRHYLLYFALPCSLFDPNIFILDWLFNIPMMAKYEEIRTQILQICNRNRDGSHATQANRKAILSLCVEQLGQAGYKVNELKPHDLKGRHINALVKRWQNVGFQQVQ